MAKQIINVTDITEYLYCPRKVYLKKIKKIKTPPTKPMILGFLKHKIFDIFNKNELIIVSGIKQILSKEQILMIYRNYLKTLIREASQNYSYMLRTFKIPLEDLEKQTLDFLKEDLIIRTNSIKKTLDSGFFGKELWRNLKPKYLTEFQIISEELGLKGRIDRILLGDKILPFEIKTRKDIFESDKIQLAAYALLLEEEFSRKINKGIIEAGKGQEEIEITEQLKNKVFEIADKIREMKEAPEFQNNFKKCKSCFLKKQCFEL